MAVNEVINSFIEKLIENLSNKVSLFQNQMSIYHVFNRGVMNIS